MDAFEASLLVSLIVAIVARINATTGNLIATIPWPVEWIPFEPACFHVDLDIGCVLALAG